MTWSVGHDDPNDNTSHDLYIEDGNGSHAPDIELYGWPSQLNRGWYRVHAYINSGSYNVYAWTIANYHARIYKRYSISSNNYGIIWQPKIFLSEADGLPFYSYYPTIEATSGSTIHRVFPGADGGFTNLFYMRSVNSGASWSTPCKLTHYANVSNPSIACDSNGNAYVAWEDSRNGHKEIYFQKIPKDFAPVESEGFTTMALPMKKGILGPVIMSGSTSPELISPVGGATVRTLRPIFKWYGLQGVKDYRIECSTTSDADALSGSPDYFITTISDISSSKPVCEYVIPENSFGLDESTPSYPYWYWRVKTVTTEASTSEVGSFNIELPLSLSSVTNWPNPFDPNKEKTKIRYRLGKQANNVIIRIYDITGTLVREMSGTNNAEGASIWNKYNDVEWDGRNGRGDLVLNGVYPFEITVTEGSKSLTGRGKIVVLK